MLDRLTLDQLRMLIAVVDDGSFSAAGRRLLRAQSAISQGIQALESTLGLALFDRSAKSPVLTEAGKAILVDARQLIRDAEALRGRAAAIVNHIEPELTLAVEVMFPLPVLTQSLHALEKKYPQLNVSVFTEVLGGGEQRLREDAARLGLFAPRASWSEDFVTAPLTDVAMIPVVSVDHPLATAKSPIGREVLERHTQLVLTDRTQLTAGFSGGVIGRRIWRFADIAARLEFLLAGFGWCNMPLHMVEPHIARGTLKRLRTAQDDGWLFPIHVVHRRDRPPGRAGAWLLDDLRRRLAPPAARTGRGGNFQGAIKHAGKRAGAKSGKKSKGR
ncbi:MAG: LysR family transcriptional regulator [Rhodobacteraceae bacterium]|nr:LysR family transcriptional regulator [Paracoccaceae bacterium]